MAKKDTNALSWRLRRARDEMGITQIDMCNRIVEIVRRSEPNFSMSPAAYNKIETGDTATPKLAVLIACKQILGIGLDELIAGETIDTEQQHPFLHDESYVIAKLADDMLPYHRRFMRLVAEDLVMHDRSHRQQDQHITEVLQSLLNYLPNGQRNAALGILDSLRNHIHSSPT